jgi:hypothetical protein
LALLLASPALSLHADDPSPSFDHDGLSGPALREQVAEFEQLLDDLARETRRLDKAAHEQLLKSLKLESHLGDQVDDVRKGLADNETVLDIQDAIRAQQARMKALLSNDPSQDAEERRLLGLQSDLITSVAGLRQRLGGQLQGMPELRARDFKAWLMVSAGQLRHRREDQEAAAQAQPTPEAEPIDAGAISPGPLSPSAQAEVPAPPAAHP